MSLLLQDRTNEDLSVLPLGLLGNIKYSSNRVSEANGTFFQRSQETLKHSSASEDSNVLKRH